MSNKPVQASIKSRSNSLHQDGVANVVWPSAVVASSTSTSSNPIAHIPTSSSSFRPQTELELFHNPELLMEANAQSAWMALTPRLFPPFYQKAGWRKGKWLEEEEAYTKKLIEAFNAGYLNLPGGTTLRCFLSERLSCDPMRITKKFAGSSCIGKQIYAPCDSRTEAHLVIKAQNELKDLEERFRAMVDVQRAVDYYPVSPMSLAALQQQQQATMAAYHLPQGYRVHNLPPEYLLALQAGLPQSMLYRGAVGEQSIPGASVSMAPRGLPQAMIPQFALGVQAAAPLAPELLQAPAMKHVYRPLQGSTGDAPINSRVNLGKNGLGLPLYPVGMVAEPATAARVLGLRPYPGVGLAVPGGLSIVSAPAGLTIPATMISTSKATSSSSAYYNTSMSSSALPQPTSALAFSSSGKGSRDNFHGMGSMPRKVDGPVEEPKNDSFVSLTNKDLYASHLLMNFFHSAASKDSNSEGSTNSDEQEAVTSNKNSHQSNGSMQQTDGDGTSSSPPSESDGVEDSSNSGSGGGNRHRRHPSSVGDSNAKDGHGSTSDTNFTDEDECGDSSGSHGEIKLTKRALDNELSNSENGHQSASDMKRRRLNFTANAST